MLWLHLINPKGPVECQKSVKQQESRDDAECNNRGFERVLGVSGHGKILAPHARLLPSVIGEMQALRDQFRELPPGSAVRVWVPVRLNVVVNVIGHAGREPLYRRRGRQPHRLAVDAVT